MRVGSDHGVVHESVAVVVVEDGASVGEPWSVFCGSGEERRNGVGVFGSGGGEEVGVDLLELV